MLSDATWHGHIIKGHPEVTPHRAAVEATISNPVEIQFSTSSQACRVYYGVPLESGHLIAVIADVVEGIVKTAYLTGRRKKGAVEWSRSTPLKD